MGILYIIAGISFIVATSIYIDNIDECEFHKIDNFSLRFIITLGAVMIIGGIMTIIS